MQKYLLLIIIIHIIDRNLTLVMELMLKNYVWSLIMNNYKSQSIFLLKCKNKKIQYPCLYLIIGATTSTSFLLPQFEFLSRNLKLLREVIEINYFIREV